MEVMDDKENQPPEAAVESLQEELPLPTVRYAGAQDQPTQILHFGESARSLFMLDKASEKRLRLVIALKDAPRSVAKWLELLRCPLTGNPTRYSKMRLLRRALTCIDSEKARRTAGYTEISIMLAKLSDSEAGVRKSFCEMKRRRVGEKQPLLYEEEAAFEHATGNMVTAKEILERGVQKEAFSILEKEEMLEKVVSGRAGWVAAFSGTQHEQKVLAMKTRMQTLRHHTEEPLSIVTTPRGLDPFLHSAESTPIGKRRDSSESMAMTPLEATPVSYTRVEAGYLTASKVIKAPVLTTPSLPTRSNFKSQTTSRKTQLLPLRFQHAGPPLRVIAINENQSDDDEDDDALMGSQATPIKPEKADTSIKKPAIKSPRVMTNFSKKLTFDVGDINHILKWNPHKEKANKLMKKENLPSIPATDLKSIEFDFNHSAKPTVSEVLLKIPETYKLPEKATGNLPELPSRERTESELPLNCRDVSPVLTGAPVTVHSSYVSENPSPRVHRPFPWELKTDAVRTEPLEWTSYNMPYDVEENRSPKRQHMDPAVAVATKIAVSSSPGSVSSLSSPLVSSMSNTTPQDALMSLTGKVMVNGQKYIKLEQIGSGGSSKVYRMLGPDLKIYALKKIKLKKLDAKTVAQFTNEIELLKLLQGNPYIIKLIAAEQDLQQRQINLIMEHGEIDLSERLRDLKGGMDENMIRVIWTQMLKAVNAIHQKRIIHGDLKPANFLFVNGALKLIDFGIAKTISNDTTNIERDSQVGTVNFMSPEAIQGNSTSNGQRNPKGKMKVGRASDIWSLGCILYQIVYSKPPFGDVQNIIEKFRCIIDPAVPINFPALQNKDLEDVIRSCLQRDHRLRPPIVGENGLLQHLFLRVGGASAASTPMTMTNAPQVLSQLGDFMRSQGVAASRVNMFVAIGQDCLQTVSNGIPLPSSYVSNNTQERRTDI
ncbi:hypothetical protein CCR75_007123 [Bremia lactucae]|uniref:Protein kinase domain-containing protein n=1 Tax=Bremia lactucae TaxID=4779 RepID=A0A976FGI4_BRELC|nr:hypothetical protein CCR75_007123 [Bremia lactucae]